MNENNKTPVVMNPFASSLGEIIRGIIRNELKSLHTCIPAIVKEVVSRGEVIVSPAVQQVNVDWQPVEWADIKLPVHTPSGNAILSSAPLTVGDTGWIIAGDLDPTLFFNDMARPARQNTFDRHNYQYGFFLPDKIKGFDIASGDDGGWYIGTSDGKTKIVLKDGEITIVSDSTLKISAKDVSISGSNKVEITGTDKVEISGKDWLTHKHDVKVAKDGVVVDPNTGMNTAELSWTSAGVK